MSNFDFVTPDGYKSMREVREELLKPTGWSGPRLTVAEIDTILEMFWFRDSYSAFIAKEDVYPKFLDFLKKQKGKVFKRIDFYNYLFADNPLLDEAVALSYAIEKRMNNDFTLKEFSELEADLHLSTEKLLASGILITDKNIIGISHHTISEYFVAQDLLKGKKPLKVFADLTIITVNQTGEEFFNPSWYGVAHFLLETEIAPDLTQFFIDLVEKNKKIVDQNYSEILSHSNLESLTLDKRQKLFNQIYTGAKESGIWISEWAVSGLVSLFSIENVELLERDLIENPKDFSEIVTTSNVVAIMGELIEQRKVVDQTILDRWKEIFIKYANQTTGSGVLQRRSLKALENYLDEQVIERVKSSFNFESSGIKEQFVQEAFLRLCYEIAPNSHTTIEYLAKGFLPKQVPILGSGCKKLLVQSRFTVSWSS